MNLCPVCGYPEMTEPPKDYYICPCCGTEFGNDDSVFTYDELRRAWLANGAHWFSRATPPPHNWNPYEQLFNADLGYGTNAISQEPKFSVVDLGVRHITIVANSTSVHIRERIVAMGNSMPDLFARIHPASA